MSFDCLVCKSTSSFYYHQEVHNRDFYKCEACSFVFVDRNHVLEFDEERKRYDGHENDKLTVGYEKFLKRLIDPIKQRHKLDHSGLDFGSGPYPMLIKLLEREGFTDITGFDPHYNKNSSYKDNRYDFITMCEVFEHVSNPLDTFEELINLLKPAGNLIISTGILKKEIKISTWYYTHDDTHINFFSVDGLTYLAEKYDLKMKVLGKDLIIFQKK